MKKMILSILVFALATSAFGGNEGPQAAPELPSKVLAERGSNGGFFVAPGSVHARQIQILSNGDVIKIEWSRDPDTEKTTPIMKLSAAQIAKVFKLVKSVKPGAMVDPNPNSPGCMDAPNFSDAVYRGNTRIEIARNAACKQYKHENATDADTKLIRILDAMETLARLQD